MAPDVASALAQLGRRQHWIGDSDLVFAGETGGYLDGSALRRRYKSALQAAQLHYARRGEDAALVAEAFRLSGPILGRLSAAQRVRRV
jgi:hypothetical protein